LLTQLWKRTRAIVGVAGITYLGIGLSIISAPLLAHTLDARGRGELAGAFAAIQVAGFVGFFALPRGLAVQDHKTGAASRVGVLVAAGLGPVNGAIIFVLADVLAGNQAWLATAIRIASITLVLGGLYQVGLEHAMLTGRLRAYNVSRVFGVVLPSLGYMAAFVFHALTLEVAFLISLGGQVGASLVGIYAAVDLIRRTRTLPTPWGFSLPVWASFVAEGVALRIDQVLLSALVAPAVLGVYSVASTLASASGGLTQAINTVAYGRIAQGSAPSDRQYARFARIGLTISIMSSAFVVAVIALWHELILGPTFGGIVFPLSVLCVSQALSDRWNLRVYQQSAAQKSKGLSMPAILGLVTMVVIVTALQMLGILGATTMALAVLANAIVRLIARKIILARQASEESLVTD